MHTGLGSKEYRCTIAGHCRTQVFEFPRPNLLLDGGAPHHFVYDTSPTHACITADLVGYFENRITRSAHYAISPSFRYEIGRTAQEIKSQKQERTPVFVVIEEHTELVPAVPMVKGECGLVDEVLEENGKKVPLLVGGRERERFIYAQHSSDGEWPQLPLDTRLVNLILAAVRVGQQTSDPIAKYVDQNCFVTDDGQFVVMGQAPIFSARATLSPPRMDADAFESRAKEIEEAISAMTPDVMGPVAASAHMALLINAMYSDEHKDDEYKRLEYLRLWESLQETAKKLGYKGDKKLDNVALGGTKTFLELTDYRDDIAHWWTDTIDENFLSSVRSTINELIRRRYF